MRISDWSSDVCSSDLAAIVIEAIDVELRAGPAGEPVEIGLEHQVEIVEIARAAAVPARDIAHHLAGIGDLKQQRARSEEHTSELQSLMRNSYAVFCLKKKNKKQRKKI